MSEQAKEQKSEQPVIDLNNYVSKDEFSKTEEALKATKAETEKLKMQLLDPKYIEFLESQRNPPKKESPADVLDGIQLADVDKLSNSQILKLAEKTLGTKLLDAVRQEFGKEVGVLRQTLQDMLIRDELREVIASNPDFEDYRADVQKILETSSSDLTITQALKIARADRGESSKKSGKNAKESDEAKPFSEKPGRSASPASMDRTFKTEKEASQAALQSVKEKYNLATDVL